FEGKLSRGKVHRLRVGTRRLRAIFEVLEEAPNSGLNRKAQRIVKFLTNALGEIRSLDVSLKLWRQRFSLPFAEAELKKSVRRARQRMSKKIGNERMAGLEKALRKILRRLRGGRANYQPAWEKCRTLAEREARASYSAFRRRGDIESLHELRIRLKQWRYLLELAANPAAEPRTIERLKALQDDIGEIHDMEVLLQWLKKDRLKRLAQKEGAWSDLKEIRRSLKDDIEAGQKSFLARQSLALAQIFPKESA
ncbi:MAG TPA: CHAD domain-containing protein, partial [bacterium]|nr:CHAD domain-containing protein [bacterium]